MKILCTENKSSGSLNLGDNLVRVFVNGDYGYGYWVPESQLFNLLSEEQKTLYLETSQAIEVTEEVVNKITEIGLSPYKKKV
jgi:hypothetical protein